MDQSAPIFVFRDIDLVTVVRVLFAFVLGGVVGFERERMQRPAGLRTHMLVCAGSACFTVASVYGFDGLGTIRDPARLAAQIITGIDGHQSQLINRMRHGDMIMRGQTLYILEVYPAAYAALAANEAEKAADIHLMEVISFGAFGRLWLGGSEAEIAAAAAAAEGALAKVTGRAPK